MVHKVKVHKRKKKTNCLKCVETLIDKTTQKSGKSASFLEMVILVQDFRSPKCIQDTKRERIQRETNIQNKVDTGQKLIWRKTKDERTKILWDEQKRWGKKRTQKLFYQNVKQKILRFCLDIVHLQ